MHTRRIISSAIFCLYIAAVAYLCFAEPEDLPQIRPELFGIPTDKIGHFLMFMPFPVLGSLVFAERNMGTGRLFIILALLLTAGIGLAAGIEQIQSQIGYRSAEKSDLIADGAGLIFGGISCVIYITFARYR